MKPTRTILNGVLIAILAANLFSSKVILVKLAYSEGASPMQVLGIRMATALPFFTVLAILLFRRKMKQRPSRMDYLAMSALGVIGYYISSVLDFYGILHISSGMERMLLYLYPSFLVLLRSVLEKTLPRIHEMMILFMAYGGASLMYFEEVREPSGNVLLGTMMILGAAACFAVYLYFSQAYIEKLGSRFFASFSTSISAVLIILHAFLFPGGDGSLSSHVVFLCAVIGIFCTVVPTYLMHYSISVIGSARFSILGTTGIIGPFLFGVILFSEPLTPARVGGALLITLSVLMLGFGRNANS